MSKRGENIYKRKDGRWEGRYHRKMSQSRVAQLRKEVVEEDF